MADAQGNRYGPYDIEVPGSESEALTEDAWFDLFGGISGVKSGGELTFNGLTANLSPIDARAHGGYLIRVDPWSDASPPTSTSAPRRDLLVGRRKRTSGEGAGAVPGKTFLTVLRGTPASTPVDPDHDPVNDERLFSWQVPGSGGTVVTDVRDLRRWLVPQPQHPRIAFSTRSYGTGARIIPGATFTDSAGLTLTGLRAGQLLTVEMDQNIEVEGTLVQTANPNLALTGATVLQSAVYANRYPPSSDNHEDQLHRQWVLSATGATVTVKATLTNGAGAPDLILYRATLLATLVENL